MDLDDGWDIAHVKFCWNAFTVRLQGPRHLCLTSKRGREEGALMRRTDFETTTGSACNHHELDLERDLTGTMSSGRLNAGLKTEESSLFLHALPASAASHLYAPLHTAGHSHCQFVT